MRKNIIYVFILLVVSISMSGFSQIPLCPADCDKLKPEAKEHYQKALENIDRVYWKGALEELREAAKADPDHVNLHFLLSRVARQRARIDTSLEESQKYYSIAENTLLQFEGRENLTRDQRAYLDNALIAVKKEKASLEQRERQRTEIGQKIIMEYLNQIGWFNENKPEEAPKTAAGQAASPGTSFSTPGGLPGAPVSSSPFGVSPNLSTPGTAPFSPESSGSSPFGINSPQAPAPSAPSPVSSPFGVTESPSTPAPAESSNPFASP